MPSRRLAALAAAFALALPGAAFAQGAGDEQYQDPFAGDDQGQSQGGGGNDQEPAATPAPAAPAAPPEPATTPVPTGGGSGGANPRELPYTGADAGVLLLAGALLIAGGTALRVRLRER